MAALAVADYPLSCRSLPGPEGILVTRAASRSDVPTLPDFCEVEGVIDARIGFVIRMPVSDWNGKFVVAGCGGFCGSLQPDKAGHSNSLNEALKLGYAALQTDAGHRDASWSTDWALGDEPALRLYAGEWMPPAVAAGRALVTGFYGVEPRRTYFSGCSNGGRLGLYAAQRYPDLFDGIAAGGAIFDLTGNSGVHGLWLLQTTRDPDGSSVIDQAKLPLLASRVMAQCDGLDGVVDGVVSTPRACRPDLEELRCTKAASAGCFTDREIGAIKRLYHGATVDGRRLFAGIPPGSEHLWSRWIVGTDQERAWGERAAEGNLRLTYGIPRDLPFNPHDYTLAEELETLQRYAPLLNATDPDLSEFAAAGGKLVYYHGLADPLILVDRVREYYAEAVAAAGGRGLDDYARFFLVPGHGHCWEQAGRVADEFNPLAVVDDWVETGVAPGHLTARLQVDGAGSPVTRKLCPYPKTSVFIDGDKERADSYVCRQGAGSQ
jgi:feruloyl esterase